MDNSRQKIFSDPELEEKRVRLLGLIRKLSYREGDFTLASGKKSKFYVNLKATSLHPEGAVLIGELIVALCKERGINPDGVGGLTLGADPLATAASMISHRLGLDWPAYIVRKEPKSHGTSQYIEGTENLKKGARLLVLEDTSTTGGSALKAVERIEAEGYECAGVLTVVDREEGAAEVFSGKDYPFLSLFKLSELRSFSGTT